VRKTKPIEERFFSKVNRTPDGGCWLWNGAVQHNGYGYLHVGGRFERRPVRAHRFSWELHRGPIPEGMHVCHSCDTPACVNPDHLFLGSRSDNMRDCASKGRVATVGKSRLTHCKHGHEFTPENTRVDKHGHRRCRACAAAIRARGETPTKAPGAIDWSAMDKED
jgi:hypothetical protein